MAQPATHLPASGAPAAGSQGAEAMHDIVDAVVIVNWWKVALYSALTLIAVLLAAWALLRWWRARQAQRDRPEATPPPPPPHLWAARELDLALRLIGDPDAFCTEVSRILREYLERRFGWNAPDRTTEEFLNGLRHESALSVEQAQALADFLGGCDLVKFARHDPTETELRHLHASALRLVSGTTPSTVHGDRTTDASATSTEVA